MRAASMVFSVVFALGLAATGCAGDPTCKEGCDRTRGCGLSSSGLSCSSNVGNCTNMDNGCARCLVDRTCDEIRNGACASACPGYRP